VRVVVTGGSGQLGTRVLRRLSADRKVKAITSIDLRAPTIASPKVRAVTADVRDPDIARYLGEHDALVHLAFVVTEARPRAEVDAINVKGSANVFEAAARANVGQIVYSSSIAAYGVVPGHPEPITEDTPRVHQPSFAYAATKFEVEAFLDRFEAEHPAIAVTRLRPAILVGHDMDHALGHGLRRRRLVDVGGAPLPIVWDEDVAEAVALALARGARGAFNVAADDALVPRELAAKAGFRAVSVPRSVARGAAALSPWLAKLGIGQAMDPAWLDSTGVRMIISSERAKRDLGWRPRCPTAADVLKLYAAEVPRRLDPRIALFFRAVERASQSRPADETRPGKVLLHLRLTGPDGGDLTIAFEQGRIAVTRGVPRPPTSALILTTATFRRLIAGQADVTTAQMVGQVRLEGDPTGVMVLGGIVATFRAAGTQPGLRGSFARRLATWFSHTPTSAAAPAEGSNP
jgi:nucleoside-diphosphate-sugar epimerase/putative sterol carrier protein